MARNFASGSTDKIAFGNVATVTTRTYSVWFNKNTVDATTRRMWDWATGGTFESIIQWSTGTGATGQPQLDVGWSTTNGQWHPDAAPSTDTWHNLCITYDGGSTANDPIFYIDGSSVASTRKTAPAGTLDSGNFALSFGNRSGGDRPFDGELCEFAQWSRILTAGEVNALGKGFSPAFMPDGLRFYLPIIGRNSPETDIKGLISGTLTGTANAAHPRIIYPSSSQMRRFAAAGAPPPAAILRAYRSLLGVGF